ncbi:cobalamin biosynthesis protein CbiG [Marinomonas agarivorans]|nr:cobalamin biosynthesis protein CbiG [Marinomonas agarivorans]
MIRIIALTESGHTLARRIQCAYPTASIWYKPTPFSEQVQSAFTAGDKLIFICATGIVMRSLAPVLQTKYDDPPVLVIDEQGQFVIPLLSGHEGGANHWALEIAQYLAAQAVITTAKPYVNPIYTVGMGCERDCPLSDLDELLLTCLEQANLTIEQIDSINSIALKQDEVGLQALADKYGKAFLTWSTDQLSSIEGLLSTKSDYVFKTVGVYGVAESACLFSAQNKTASEPELLLPKRKNTKATCAIARSFFA